jgi:DTW domain-containing protein YfiP
MREVCRRCLRPVAHCVCDLLPRIQAPTRVVILQHPREARLAICSAWLCHAALEGSALVQAVRLDEHPRVAPLLAEPGTWLLFPGAEAALAAPSLSPRPRTLVALDATWPQALQLLRRNPKVAALPRLTLAPGAAESGYLGLRREPEPGHLATIDAVAEALGGLEGDLARYAPMRLAFRVAVERQLAHARGTARAPRHRPGAAARYASPGGDDPDQP